MSSAGTATVNASERIYDDANGCSSFLVRCEDDSLNPAEVHIDGLHDPEEWFLIPVGKEYIFRLNHLGIRKVYARGSGGDASIAYGVVAKTQAE